MLALFLAPALGFAAGPTRALQELTGSATEGPPSAAFACAPMGSVLRLVGSMPLPPMLLAGAADDPAAAFWLGLLDPARAREAGIDLEGATSFAMWGEEVARIELPFEGDFAAAETMLRTFGEVGRTDTAGHWTIANERELLDVRLEGDRIRLSEGRPPAGEGARTPGLLGGLPEVPGCALYADLDALPGEEKLAGVRLAAFLPLEGGAPFTVRVSAPKVPAVLAHSVAAPIGGSSTATPSMLLAIGVPPVELVRDLAELVGTSEGMPEIDDGRVVFEPGITIAFFDQPQKMDFAAVLGVRRPSGKSFPPGRMARASKKVLQKGGTPVTRIDRTQVVATMKDMVIFASFGEGRVAVGTNQQAVVEAIEGVGTPWVDGAFAAHAAEWPVAIGASGGFAGMPEAALRGGLRAREGVYELEIALDDGGTGTMRAAVAAGVGMASAMAVPAFVELQKKTKRAEAQNHVDRIYEAQMRRESQGFLALPVAPRDPGALTADRVPFAPAGAWLELLGADGGAELRGTYWVELSVDGASFIVHGLIDSDGDGVPAHFRRGLGGVTERLTPEEIF